MVKMVWIGIGDTKLLMQHLVVGQLQEWHPVAQVARRQMYDSFPIKWHAWIFDEAPNGPEVTVGDFDDVTVACIATEIEFQLRDAML